MISKIKEQRVSLDGIAQIINRGEVGKSRELSLAYTSLQLSKMWLGRTLKALEVENPYPQSKNIQNSIVSPTADVHPGFSPPQELNIDGQKVKPTVIQSIKFLRRLMDVNELLITELLKEAMENCSKDNYEKISSLEYSLKYLIEGSMWLGMELANHK